jgi:hypothetical protein
MTVRPRYYAVSARRDMLYDADGLARYYLTEAREGSYDGCLNCIGPAAVPVGLPKQFGPTLHLQQLISQLFQPLHGGNGLNGDPR